MVKFDYKVKCGPEYVALRVVDISEGFQRSTGGIYIAENSFANSKLGMYQVEDIGDVAEKLTDVHVGDYVMADKLAIFYKSEPIGIMRYNSMIVKTDANKTAYHPLLNMCLVSQDRTEIKQDGGIYIQNRDDILNIGTLVEQNIDEERMKTWPFKAGDKVFMSKCSDLIRAGTENIYIYKCEDVLCKILE